MRRITPRFRCSVSGKLAVDNDFNAEYRPDGRWHRGKFKAGRRDREHFVLSHAGLFRYDSSFRGDARNHAENREPFPADSGDSADEGRFSRNPERCPVASRYRHGCRNADLLRDFCTLFPMGIINVSEKGVIYAFFRFFMSGNDFGGLV